LTLNVVDGDSFVSFFFFFFFDSFSFLFFFFFVYTSLVVILLIHAHVHTYLLLLSSSYATKFFSPPSTMMTSRGDTPRSKRRNKIDRYNSRPACLKKAPVILIGRRLNVEPSVTGTSARRASRERERERLR